MQDLYDAVGDVEKFVIKYHLLLKAERTSPTDNTIRLEGYLSVSMDYLVSGHISQSGL